jgi:hypothetical protein
MRETLWPRVAVRERPKSPEAKPYVRSYIFMRFAIGLLGATLPLMLFAEPLFFDGQPFLRGSLSAYYYSGMREFFVGVLWAIGVFLITYKFADGTQEARASTYAGFAAILVALFPTQRPGAGFPLTPLQSEVGEDTVEFIHFGAAGVFIFFLGLISVLFGRSGHRWPRLHFVCAGVIGAELLLAAFAGITGEPDKGLLFAEVFAVMAFTVSWMATVEFDYLFRNDRTPGGNVR